MSERRDAMRLLDILGNRPLFLDGAMGTMLQRVGLPLGMAPDLMTAHAPEKVRAIHRAYLEAGAHLVKANTFGCNRLKLAESGHDVSELAGQAVALARSASDTPHLVAMDIGPCGKLLSPLGDLDFEEAVDVFGEAALAGAKAGADCVLIETMSDAYELKAAVLGAKKVGLPVLATVTVDARGKLLTGADMATIAALLECLRVDAMGLNCGLGAEAMLESLEALRACTGLPLIIGPNAGLPRQEGNRTVFDETPEAFGKALERAADMGACAFGGCCGTTPDHIAAMVHRLRGKFLQKNTPVPRTVVSSGSKAVILGGTPILIGERINPTGKPPMKKALQEGDMGWMLREAVRQQEAGADMLDINVGLPGIDEAQWLARLVAAVQSVSDLPLQLDTANPEALSSAMRRYNGKPMINSVNGKVESMEAVFPLVAQYGGVVVALTLDEAGIPATAEGRVAIAKRIIEAAAAYGIHQRDIVVDPLTMAISAEPDAAAVALTALERIRQELGVHTVLGVSNISFGLPRRDAMNAAFYTLAAGAGLSAAILSPFAPEMMRAVRSVRALLKGDPGCAAYIEAMKDDIPQTQAAGASAQTLRQAVEKGLAREAQAQARALVERVPPLEVIEAELIPALNAVGDDFASGKAFLPQLLMSAEAAKAAFEALRAKMPANEKGGRGAVVIATVHGDIHDIGKNIAKALLENYRFDVIDLGRDVPPEAVVEAAKQSGARLIGLSALMTTTVTSMEETIRQLREALPDVKIMVGGAVLTENYASRIGANQYVRDAMDSVRYAEKVYAPQDGTRAVTR